MHCLIPIALIAASIFSSWQRGQVAIGEHAEIG